MEPAKENGDLTYYPAYCHSVSPTYFTWVKMGAADVHLLKQRKGFEGQNLYFYNNHPIQFVCLAGIIVSRDEHPHRTILVLDDSTGSTIEVICSKPKDQDQHQQEQQPSAPNPDPDPVPKPKPKPKHISCATNTPLDISALHPGTTAKLKGTITCFRNMLQLHLERYVLLPDTNAEVDFWEQRTRVFVEMLHVPWVLEGREVERLKRESVEGEERRRRRRFRKEREREERVRRREEREERDRVRIERGYAREERVREVLAREVGMGKGKGSDRLKRRGVAD